MRQPKLTLSDLLSLLSVLLFCLVCFLGAYFFTLGNTSQSLIVTLIIAVSLSGTAFGAKILKRTNSKFITCFVFEMIFLVLFTVLFIFFSYRSFPHFFVVSGQRAEIKEKLTISITQAENMFAKYEEYAQNRENLYKDNLRKVVAAKRTNPSDYATFGFVNNSVHDTIQIENKMFTVHSDLFPTNYEEMQKAGSKWLVNAQSTLNSWWAWNFGVVNIVNNMETSSNKWLKTLTELSSIREQGEKAIDFSYSLSFDDVKKHFTTHGEPTMLSIGLAIGAYLIILLTYFVSERSSKSPICKNKRNRNKPDFVIDI